MLNKYLKICQDDFNNFDYILCMDESNYEDLREIAPGKTAKKSMYH